MLQVRGKDAPFDPEPPARRDSQFSTAFMFSPARGEGTDTQAASPGAHRPNSRAACVSSPLPSGGEDGLPRGGGRAAPEIDALLDRKRAAAAAEPPPFAIGQLENDRAAVLRQR